MKRKIFVFIFAIVIVQVTFAQKFVVTPDGIRNSENLELDYIVIDSLNKSAEELFDLAKKFIIHNYQNPDIVTKGEIGGDFLSFKSSFIIPAIAFHDAIFTYFTTMHFKEGRVKITITNVIMEYADSGKFAFRQSLHAYGIYDSSGTKLKREDTKSVIENNLNTSLLMLSNYLKDNIESDDW